MSLAFAVTTAIFLVIEALRLARTPPLADAVNRLFAPFIDSRDEGTAVLTHIYLLLGCSLPAWYAFFFFQGVYSTEALLVSLSGCTVIGLGDAAASFVGTSIGKHRWPGSKKTLEGSAAMMLSMIFFQTAALIVVGFHHIDGGTVAWIVVADFLVVLLEAVTEQIDNLVLPLYHVALLQLID